MVALLQPLLLLAAAAATLPPALAVKTDDFKTCAQSAFCRRLRSLAPRQAASPATWASPYSVVGHAALQSTGDDPTAQPSIVFPVASALFPGEAAFELKVDVVNDGIARVRLDEVGSPTGRRRYDEAPRWALVDGALSRASFDLNTDDRTTNVSFPSSSTPAGMRLVVEHAPLKLSLFREGEPEPEVVLNGRGLLHMEHFRSRSDTPAASEPDVLAEAAQAEGGAQTVLGGGPAAVDRSWFEGPQDEWERDMWEEKWRTWTDSKPKGPEALSIDIAFPSAQTHLFGLPEHASPLSLPSTRGPNAHYSDPYRLFNVDIFEYLADSPMAMYGAVPYVQAHSTKGTVGVVVLTASETWVDVEHAPEDGAVDTHWLAESGVLDVFLLPGAAGAAGPASVARQYAALTGPHALPAHWALGYHQCRWNYLDQADVLAVDARFDEVTADEKASGRGGQGWPLDVTWLDIEYADEHRYFDWDHAKFPDVKGMLAKIAAKGRKMVAIVDPHIKRTESFPVYASAVEQDLLIKRAGASADGARTDFDGWCWTGSSVWVDFFLERSWSWWTERFAFDVWADSARNLFIWNDMNEPSVFNGPEISMPRDALHQDGKWEHRDVHNINGLMFAKQTALALTAREDPPQRPFVLSRSFYAGSQRWGAVWTGDNLGTWAHLAGSFPMLLSLNIAGISFSGADVGGFFGNPTPEFLVRFYQAGVFMPFFRAHAHIDTKRREPYLLEEPFKGYVRDMLRLRYAMLPVWYTAFCAAAVDGAPVLRPQYVVHPSDAAGFAIDDQFYVGGSGLLVKPVVEEEAEETEIYLADDQPYYDYFSHHMYPSSAKPRTIPYAAPLSAVPVLHQGGSILPLRTRIRRASPLMWQDPYTLVVALAKDQTAAGELYSDDGTSFAFARGDFVWRGFEFAPAAKGSKGAAAVLRSVDLAAARPKDVEGLLAHTADVGAYAPTNGWAQAIAHVRVERIVVLGLAAAPKAVRVAGQDVAFEWEKGVAASGARAGRASELTLKNPPVLVASDWEITFE